VTSVAKIAEMPGPDRAMPERLHATEPTAGMLLGFGFAVLLLAKRGMSRRSGLTDWRVDPWTRFRGGPRPILTDTRL
jgi:hypothetical protein